MTLEAAPDTSLIDRLRTVCERHAEVRLALLFGSHARRRATAASDVDVAVEGKEVDTLELAAALSDAVGAEVDVVELHRAGYPLLKAVLRDGVLIHQRDPHALARFRTRAILTLETDRSWYERMRDGFLRRLAEDDDG